MSPRCSARASISRRARAGTTLAAFGSIANSPTVAAKWTSPAAERRWRSPRSPSTSRAAAASASWRAPIGVVPAWSARPFDDDLDAGDPGDGGDDADIELLVLQHRPLLDMQFEERLDVAARSARCPDRRRPRTMACRERDPLGFARQPFRRPDAGHAAAADAGDAEDRDLLGEEVDDLEVMLELDASGRASARATSSAADTPAMPSKRPPSGTVSECEPSMMVPAPGHRARRACRSGCPPHRSGSSSPAAWNRRASHSRPLRNIGVKARRVQGRSGSVIAASASISSAMRSARVD